VDGYAGDFSLATSVEGHPSGTLVHVTVPALQPSRLVLDFSDHQQVLTDASVLLSGNTGAQKLLELGYTGPLTTRPRLAASAVPAQNALEADFQS
jgi:predicted xylose isomerase-like sugar epimerase